MVYFLVITKVKLKLLLLMKSLKHFSIKDRFTLLASGVLHDLIILVNLVLLVVVLTVEQLLQPNCSLETALNS